MRPPSHYNELRWWGTISIKSHVSKYFEKHHLAIHCCQVTVKKIRGGSTYGPNRHRPPPFWQINHANSAYFRLFLGYFRVISAIRPPPFGSRPPLFIYPGSAPENVCRKLPFHDQCWVQKLQSLKHVCKICLFVLADKNNSALILLLVMLIGP